MKRQIIFKLDAFEEYSNWATQDKKVFKKLIKLVREIQRTPFQGTGNPEPLKHNLKGYWSRRITQEHRLVYEVTDSSVIIYACKDHYGK